MAEFKYAFISHKNVEPDFSITKRMSEYLGKQLLATWYDKHLVGGEEWAAQISKKLDNASIYIIVASENSLSPALSTEQIMYELGNIMKERSKNKKILIPFVIDDYYFNMDSGTAKYFLGGNLEQAVVLSKYPTEEAAFEKLAEYLKIYLDCYKNNINDFERDEEDITLKKYKGKDSFVVIPDFIKTIGENAFLKNSTLERVELPPNVKVISKRAFMGCSNLTDVLGMEGVECCDISAFDRTAVYIGPNNNYLLNGVVFGGDAADGVLTLPPKTRVIATRAFSCSDAKTIILPEGLEHIGSRAFYDSCLVENIIIPSTVKTIGEKAFEGCSKLEKVVFKGEMPEGANSAFPQYTEIIKEN